MYRVFLGSIAVLAVMFGVAWVVKGNDFFMMKVFAPREEAVRRDTFEQSKAYTQGQVQELQNMQFDYAKATPEQQTALASIILHRAADFDETKLSSDLRAFVGSLRSQAQAVRP